MGFLRIEPIVVSWTLRVVGVISNCPGAPSGRTKSTPRLTKMWNWTLRAFCCYIQAVRCVKADLPNPNPYPILAVSPSWADRFLNPRPAGGGGRICPPPGFSKITPKPLQISTQNLVYLILHQFDIEWPNLVESARKFVRNWRFCVVTSRQFWPKSAQC